MSDKQPQWLGDHDRNTGRGRPTHLLKCKVRPGAGIPGAPDNAHNTVGAVWLNDDDNSISISLRPGIVISWNDGLQLTAFVNEDR